MIFKCTFLIAGVGILIGAFSIYKNNIQLNDSQGIVVKLRTTGWSNIDPEKMYQPMVEFTDDKGTLIQFYAATFSSPSRYSVNEKVPVIYNPESPEKAKIQSFISLWAIVPILVLFGLMMFIFGLYLLNNK